MIETIYFLIGMYIAGKNYPYNLPMEKKDDVTLSFIAFGGCLLFWPVYLGILKNQNIKTHPPKRKNDYD